MVTKLSLSSVETVVKKCKDIVTFANSSNKWYPEFYKNQETLQGIKGRLSLKGDVATRYAKMLTLHHT